MDADGASTSAASPDPPLADVRGRRPLPDSPIDRRCPGTPINVGSSPRSRSPCARWCGNLARSPRSPGSPPPARRAEDFVCARARGRARLLVVHGFSLSTGPATFNTSREGIDTAAFARSAWPPSVAARGSVGRACRAAAAAARRRGAGRRSSSRAQLFARRRAARVSSLRASQRARATRWTPRPLT